MSATRGVSNSPEGRKATSAWPTRSRAAAVAPEDVSNVYLPVKKLVTYSGLCERTLRTYLADPVRPLPHFRIGGRILVRCSDFDAWASQFRVTPAVRAGFDTLVDDVVASLR